MNKKKALKQFTVLIAVSLILTLIIFIIDFRIFPSSEVSGSGFGQFSAVDSEFIEGVILVIMGVLDFLASGISYGSRISVGTVAASKAIFGDTVEVGPSEILRKNTWKKLGLLSVGSVTIITGIFLLFAYFLSL